MRNDSGVPAPSDKASYDAWDKVSDDTEPRLRGLTEAIAADGGNRPGSEAQKIGDLHTGFMDERALERLSGKPLRAEFARALRPRKADAMSRR